MNSSHVPIFRRSLVIAIFFLSTCNANSYGGILIGSAPGNDHLASVVDLIDDYNDDNDPNYFTSISHFKKTDSAADAGFVFNATNDANGFSFFASDQVTAITSPGDLHDEESAFFSYSGPENLLFYSVKASNEFTLYTFMPGLNLLQLETADHDMSHVTFWTGPPGIDVFGNPVPEPTSLLGATAIAACLLPMSRKLRGAVA